MAKSEGRYTHRPASKKIVNIADECHGAESRKKDLRQQGIIWRDEKIVQGYSAARYRGSD
jgi:hypothetical protein